MDHASLSSDMLANIAHVLKNRGIRTLNRIALRDHGAQRRISGHNPSKRIRGPGKQSPPKKVFQRVGYAPRRSS